jgi:hypothetical protein
LWNLTTSLRRQHDETHHADKEAAKQRKQALCLLRVLAFLVLDSATGDAKQTKKGKHCIRLMKVALKTGRVCIEEGDTANATKVLERAADYQEILAKGADSGSEEENVNCRALMMEYFGLRMALVRTFYLLWQR